MLALIYLNLKPSFKIIKRRRKSQRIRLATQIGSQLQGITYILDEPSIGLHQRDNQRLITALQNLRNIGNSVLVVEHDKDIMLAADYLIDIGPKAGVAWRPNCCSKVRLHRCIEFKIDDSRLS